MESTKKYHTVLSLASFVCLVGREKDPWQALLTVTGCAHPALSVPLSLVKSTLNMKLEGGKRPAHTQDSNTGWAPETTGHEGECAGYMLFKKDYSILWKHIIFIWKVKHTYCFNNTTYLLRLHRYMENGSYIFKWEERHRSATSADMYITFLYLSEWNEIL